MWPLLALLSTANAEPRALLLGIGDYPEANGWADLHAEADLEALRVAWIHRGIPAERIVVLSGPALTREGLEAALQRWLVDDTETGDHLVLHFSGHGQQLPDDDGDEVDGLDEALVPWDAPMHPPAGYDGSYHLRDDALAGWIGSARKAAGPAGSVTVTLDTCFSGSLTRGIGLTVRGGPAIGGGRGARHPVLLEPAPDPSLAPLTVLSAARTDQQAHEVWGPDGEPMGAFSAALAGVLGGPSPLPTWSALHEQVQTVVRSRVPDQEPQATGDVATRLLDGRAATTPPYVTIDGKGALTGGLLRGMAVGHRVGAWPPGSDGTGPALVSGAVTEVKLASARVAWDAPTSLPAGARVFVTEATASPTPLRLRVDLPSKEAWARALDIEPTLEVAEPADLRLGETPMGRLELRDVATGAEIQAWEGSRWQDADPAGVEPARSRALAHLRRIARAHLLRRAAPGLDDPRHQLTLSLTAGGVEAREVADGTPLSLRIARAPGSDTTCVDVIHLASDHTCELLAEPRCLHSLSETITLDLVATASPPGRSEVMVFGTPMGVDLASVCRPAATRGSLDATMALLGSGTRGVTLSRAGAGAFATSRVLIVEP